MWCDRRELWSSLPLSFFFVFVFNDDDDFHYIRVHAWHILKTLLTTYEYTTTYTHTHTHITNKPTSNFFFVRTNLLFPFGVDSIFFLNVFLCMYVCVFAECTIVLNGWLVCWFFFWLVFVYGFLCVCLLWTPYMLNVYVYVYVIYWMRLLACSSLFSMLILLMSCFMLIVWLFCVSF